MAHEMAVIWAFRKWLCARCVQGLRFAFQMSQADAYRMIRRRAKAAGIHTKIGNHNFWATET
jgi:hypothetical protein